jgi:hypothetical protein
MTGMVANLLLNILIVGLLAATISYCWILNRRIKVLQDSKSELAQLLTHFDESTQRASESIIALQTASKKIGENIQHRIEKANFILDDMAFMIEKGSKLSNQLEASFAVDRARTRVMAEEHEQDNEPLSRPQLSELAKPKAPEKPNHKERTVASLEAVLERVVGKKPAAFPEEEQSVRPQALRPRSKTEQELLDMIKSGMKG